jgi:Na+/proline symporter/signal transduction histidine kinase
MSSSVVILVSVLYLALLFAIAYWAENRTRIGKSPVTNPYIYSLSLAVFCTAWTFFGSVGRAVNNGIEFLAVYIGPTLIAPLGWLLGRKIIRICKVQRITSIADLISSRYGKNITLGVLVTIFSVISLIPYIALQLKAIDSSFNILANRSSGSKVASDISLYIAIGLGVFIIFFGTRKVEATERHEGLVTAIATESIIKLVAFLTIGIYVTYFLFDGLGDIFKKAALIPELKKQFTIQTDGGYAQFFWHTLLSMLALLFLPRQFQLTYIENVNENHLNKSIWLFPLYLFIINIFVLPIAFGGRLLFANAPVNPDDFVLAIPLYFDNDILAVFIYLGGFSAATGMIIVETIALSMMISNSVVMPLILKYPVWQSRFSANPTRFVIYTRRFAILAILLFAYAYHRTLGNYYSLVSIGLVSFVAVSQFAPSVIGGIFWKQGNRQGALVGLVGGFIIWFYTLVLPSLTGIGIVSENLITHGLWGVEYLKPFELFGLTGLDSISHATFWSLFVNIILYVIVSVNTSQSSIEHNQAILFVDVFKFSTVIESSTVWKGTAYIPDIRSLLVQFFGEARTDRVIRLFAQRYNIDLQKQQADPRLVSYAEKLLAGVIGAASARIMVSSVSKEEKISVDEIVDILKASQELMAVNKELRKKSIQLERLTKQLQETNEQLKRNDKLKDDFLSTVTHELRTPLTSIRALSEIVFDDPQMDAEDRNHFLGTIIKEAERLSRLIGQVLDLEKYESGRTKVTKEEVRISEVITDSLAAVEQLAKEKNIHIKVVIDGYEPIVKADRDKLIQVMVNLISNATKFCEIDKGEIKVTAFGIDSKMMVSVIDNGSGIAQDYQKLIFEKFYQAENQTIRKPKGSGLGLAICKKIIELHNGRIWVESELGKGASFSFFIPIDSSPLN